MKMGIAASKVNKMFAMGYQAIGLRKNISMEFRAAMTFLMIRPREN
jgi:hypothetical protein